LGIIIEGFVKITQPEEDDGIGMLCFDIEILLSAGCDFAFGHECSFVG
jgi:hypothetical protein